MPEIIIQPLQWSALPPLHDAPPLDDTDAACLDEVRAVLARHGKLKRFAVHLAHSHFELAPGEVLIERPDPDGRTQHVTVGRLEDEPGARPTTWLLDAVDVDGRLLLTGGVHCVCVSDSPYALGACTRHGHSETPSPGAQKEEAGRDQERAREKAWQDAERMKKGGPRPDPRDRGRER